MCKSVAASHVCGLRPIRGDIAVNRGSTVFWEQQGLQTFGQRIQITRPQASQPAFERHFAQLMEEYGSVHAINLLGSKENEASLTLAFSQHLQVAKGVLGDDLGITNFDFHNAVRSMGHDNVFRELRFERLS
jgi:synaptojanin